MEKLVPKLRFPEFGDEWSKSKLSQKMEIFRGASPRPKGDPRYYGGNIPRLMIEDVTRDGKYAFPKIDFLTEEGAKKSRLLKKGSVVLSCSGTRVAIPGILGVDACIHDGWLGFKNLKEVDTNFLYYLFVKLHDRMQGSATTGGVFNNLTTSIVKDLKLGFPILPEQTIIASFLTSVDERITLLERQKQGLETYKKGVMQQLFSQQLRFKDDKGKDFPDWEEKKLGDEVLITKGQQLNKETLSLEGNYPCQNGGIEPSGYTDNFNAYENTITISEGGNSCGYVNYMSTKFWCGGHCYTLTDVKLENKFLYQYLKYHQEQIMNLRVGSGLPNIQKSTLSSFKIHKPCLAEQKKIASFLSAIDARIEVVSKQIEQSKVFKKGLLQQLFV